MAPADFAALAPHLVPIKLSKGFRLVAAGALIVHVYFLESGIASIIATSPDGLEVETCLFGRDGVGPMPLVLGCDRSMQHVVIQVAGEGYRIASAPFTARLGESALLRNFMFSFVQVMTVQAAHTALSNAVHTVDERLARWLLMCHDRVESDEIAITHEFLSIMLAVRRPTVTSSLHVLEGNGFVRGERGYVTVRHRKELEDFAADAYGRPEAEYARLIGPMG